MKFIMRMYAHSIFIRSILRSLPQLKVKQSFYATVLAHVMPYNSVLFCLTCKQLRRRIWILAFRGRRLYIWNNSVEKVAKKISTLFIFGLMICRFWWHIYRNADYRCYTFYLRMFMLLLQLESDNYPKIVYK